MSSVLHLYEETDPAKCCSQTHSGCSGCIELCGYSCSFACFKNSFLWLSGWAACPSTVSIPHSGNFDLGTCLLSRYLHPSPGSKEHPTVIASYTESRAAKLTSLLNNCLWWGLSRITLPAFGTWRKAIVLKLFWAGIHLHMETQFSGLCPCKSGQLEHKLFSLYVPVMFPHWFWALLLSFLNTDSEIILDAKSVFIFILFTAFRFCFYPKVIVSSLKTTENTPNPDSPGFFKKRFWKKTPQIREGYASLSMYAKQLQGTPFCLAHRPDSLAKR